MKIQMALFTSAVAIAQLVLSLPNAVYASDSDAGPQRAAFAPALPTRSASRQVVAAPFVENQGQIHADVAFYTRSTAGTVFVTRSGEVVASLPDSTGERRAVIRETLGTGRDSKVVAGTPALTRINHLTGDPGSSHTDIRTYHSVSLGERYVGIDVELRSQSSNIEKFFHVNPGADPAAITVGVEGVDALRLENDGSLTFATGLGPVSMTAPIAYQLIEGERYSVDVHYRVDSDTYGFEVGAYDRDYPLTIDPVLASYLGGTDLDQGYAIDAADDGTGELVVYVTGAARSADFPDRTGVDPSFGGGTVDAFVAKLDTQFNTLVTTYLGGTLDDEGRDLLVHAPSGAIPAGPRVFVTGTTNSPDFVPRDPGSRTAGQVDAFVVSLSPNLDAIEGSSYLGGSGSTDTVRPYAMAVLPRPSGPFDTLYLAGRTRSSSLTGNGSASGNGADDVFVAILSTEPSLAIERSIYLGGPFNDQAFDIVLDDDSVYVAGLTSTGQPDTSSNLPGIEAGVSAVDSYDGNEDGFISKLALDDLTLIRSTYFGGVERDFAQALVLHPNGDLYAAGGTFSADIDQPDPGSAAYANPRGSFEAWLARFDTNLTNLRQSTYFGGSRRDVAYDLHVNPDTAEVLVYGRTGSLDLSDTAGGLQSVGSNNDVFLARLDPALSSVNQATYYGGTLFEEILGPGMDLAVDSATGALTVFITGTTGSDDLPGVTAASAQMLRGGSNDAFVASLDPSLQASGPMFAAILPTSRAVATTTTATAFVTLVNAGPTTLIDCSIAPATSLPVDFTYQTTDPATNELTGTPNTPVPIPTGSAQSFVVAFEPTDAFAGTEVTFDFVCDDVAVAPIPGLNTLYLSASDTPGPDVIALAASAVPGQVVLDSVNGAGAFAVATANVGVSGSVTVSAITNTSAVLSICQTDPVNGVCINPPVAAPVALTILDGATPTFGVFAFNDEVIGFDPAVNRVFFEVRDSAGNLIGSTSVAISKPQ